MSPCLGVVFMENHSIKKTVRADPAAGDTKKVYYKRILPYAVFSSPCLTLCWTNQTTLCQTAE